jgi:hypothetical protein
MSFGTDFLEKVILLLLTALITGFSVPFVLKRVEERKARHQKKFEADLARQGKIIDAQSKLLDDITAVLWKWRYLAKKVAYYGREENAERYEGARKAYDENVWDLLEEFRSQISKSRRLISEEAYKGLGDLYKYIVYDIDDEISDLIKEEGLNPKTVRKFKKLSTRFTEQVSQRLDDAIYTLANELQLKAGK